MGVSFGKRRFAGSQTSEEWNLILTRKSSAITDYQSMADRVVRMVKEKKVITHDNKDANIEVQTVCIHGDTPGAPQLVKTIVASLQKADVEIVRVKDIIA